MSSDTQNIPDGISVPRKEFMYFVGRADVQSRPCKSHSKALTFVDRSGKVAAEARDVQGSLGTEYILSISSLKSFLEPYDGQQ